MSNESIPEEGAERTRYSFEHDLAELLAKPEESVEDSLAAHRTDIEALIGRKPEILEEYEENAYEALEEAKRYLH